MRRLIFLVLAVLSLLLAALSLPLPLPAGFMFTTIAFALVLMSSPGLQRWFHVKRRRFPRFDARLRVIEAYLPAAIRRALNGGRAPRTR